MKSYLLIILLLVGVGCHVKQKEKKTHIIESKYPQQVESAGIKALYDSAKWYLYTWNCDKLYKPKSDSTINMPLGEIELTFGDIFFRHDTVVLGFDFMDKGQPILTSMTRDGLSMVTGVGFDTTTKRKIYMVASNVTFYSKGDSTSRYENPLQPEVISFIRNNKDRLSPWFREEAKRRGIIE